MNYFKFYDLPVTIVMDASALKKIYFRNSRELHPDMHAGAEGKELEEIERKSAVNSEAYEVLGDFDLRLKHIVTILSNGSIEAPQLSPEFLMEMMEINESVESMNDEEKAALKKDILERDRNLYEGLGDTIKKDLSGASEDEIEAVKDYYFHRKYLLRILENLDNLASL